MTGSYNLQASKNKVIYQSSCGNRMTGSYILQASKNKVIYQTSCGNRMTGSNILQASKNKVIYQISCGNRMTVSYILQACKKEHCKLFVILVLLSFFANALKILICQRNFLFSYLICIYISKLLFNCYFLLDLNVTCTNDLIIELKK